MCFVLIRISQRDLSTEEILLFCSNLSSKLCLNCPSLPSHFTPPWLPWELQNKAQSLHWMFWTPYPLAYFTFMLHKHSQTLTEWAVVLNVCMYIVFAHFSFFCFPLIPDWWYDYWGEQVRTQGKVMIFPVLAEKIQRRDGTGLTVEEEITLRLSSLLPLFQQTYFLRRIIQSATYQISVFPPISHDVMTHWGSHSFYILLPSCKSFCL